MSKSKYISQNIKDKFSLTDITVLDKIIDITSKKKIRCYLVGGAVRDIILGKTPKDLDFVVDKKAENISSEIALELNGEVLSNSEFGTSKLSFKKSIYDIANARSETYAHPGALPKVTRNSIDKDLWRRDFSINSIAIQLTQDEDWQILDPTDGLADISHGTIRVLHDKSFVDDPTRIFRAIKYSTRFGFSIDEKTEKLIGDCIKSNYINKISGNRILSEVSQILEEDHFKTSIKLLSSLGILSSIHPKKAQILHDIQTIKQNTKSLSKTKIINSELMMLLDKLDIEAISCIKLISKNESLGNNLSNFLDKLRFIKPKIAAKEMISLGIAPGPQIGSLLADIRFAVADGVLKTATEEKQFIIDKMQ